MAHTRNLTGAAAARSRVRRASLPAAAALLALALPGCGGGSGSVTGPSVNAPPARQRQVINGSWRVDPVETSGQVFYFVFDVRDPGDLDASVDWTHASNDVDIGLGSGDCTGHLDTCNLLAESTSVTAKPERVSRSGLVSGRYTLVIANFGSTTEQGTYEIGLTR